MELHFDDHNLCLGIGSPEYSSKGVLEGVATTDEVHVLDGHSSRTYIGLGSQTMVRRLEHQGHYEWH